MVGLSLGLLYGIVELGTSGTIETHISIRVSVPLMDIFPLTTASCTCSEEKEERVEEMEQLSKLGFERQGGDHRHIFAHILC